MDAEIVPEASYGQYSQNGILGDTYPTQEYPQPSGGDYFGKSTNNLEVIKEYNSEENIPNGVRKSFWGLLSKSLKLGFWNETDEQMIFFHKNIIRVGHIMSMPKHRYTFSDRQQMNQLDFLVYADFKRGVGMEKYRINERTLQATSVTQSISGGGGGGKKGGIFAGLKNFFG